ncbi:MAG: DMT family transporter [Thermovirgaceae bacterium]|nr:DMT family transporter [Thermovirgaceae bacterium]
MTSSHPGRFAPFFVLLLGVIGISTGSIFARYADASPIVISFYRTGIAAAVMLPLVLLRHREEMLALGRGDFFRVLLAGMFLALHFSTWITSLFYTSVASSVVIVQTIPVWTAILAPFVSKERVSRLTWAGIGVSFCGVLVISAGDFALGGTALFGDLLALAGAWFATLYFLTGRVVRAKVSLPVYTFICYGASAVVLLVVILLAGLPLKGFSSCTWGAFVGMALISQIMGHSSYNWALRYLSASLVAVALLGEPIGATILAWVLFGETLTLAKVIGGALILAGIVTAVKGERS